MHRIDLRTSTVVAPAAQPGQPPQRVPISYGDMILDMLSGPTKDGMSLGDLRTALGIIDAVRAAGQAHADQALMTLSNATSRAVGPISLGD